MYNLIAVNQLQQALKKPSKAWRLDYVQAPHYNNTKNNTLASLALLSGYSKLLYKQSPEK